MSYSLQTPSINHLTRTAQDFHLGRYKAPTLTGTIGRRKQRRHLLKMGISPEQVDVMLKKMGYAEPKRRAK